MNDLAPALQNALDWSLLRSFAAVMRHGTLSAAAVETRQSQPTLGRHVRELEAVVGEPLFERRGNQIIPTERASALYGRVSAMEEAAQGVARLLAGTDQRERGTVRLSVPEALGVHIAPPVLAQFQRAHPQIDLELVPTNSADDLMRREADIAVRFFRPTQPDLVMTRIGVVEVGVFASPAYIEQFGEPTSLVDFARHRLIGDDESGRVITGMRAYGVTIDRSAFCYRTDSVLAQIAAVEAGVGIGAGLLQAFQGRAVKRVLEGQIRIAIDAYVVAHSDLYRNPRIRLLYDHLVTALKAAFAAPGQSG